MHLQGFARNRRASLQPPEREQLYRYRRYSSCQSCEDKTAVDAFNRLVCELIVVLTSVSVAITLFYHSLQRISWNPYSERLYARINVSSFL